MNGKRVSLIGGGVVVAYLLFRWYRNRSASQAQTGSQALASIPGGNVPIMPGGGGTTVNPTATVSTPSSKVTTFSSLTPAHPAGTGTYGDIAGRPGENRWTASTPAELISKGGTWALHRGWQGPGTYQAEKYSTPQGTTTEIVRVA